MNTEFPETQARYLAFLQQTPSLLASSLTGINEASRDTFREYCQAAKRIFFTAAGSSIPAALYGSHQLAQAGYATSLLPTGSLLGLHSLGPDDLVVLCSQGMNRADAALVVAHVAASEAKLMVFTANRVTPLNASANLTVLFDPETEKLFCRPTGVATNLAVMAAILDNEADPGQLVAAWEAGRSQAMTFTKHTRYVTLASDMLLPTNWNMALALREGCGILAQNFDIETYAHGNYVGDLAHEPYEYIVLSADPATEAARSVRRFLPFITGSKVPYQLVEAPYADAARANLYLLGVIAQSTYDANEAHAYNMNTPRGKEENRYYHELESYEL